MTDDELVALAREGDPGAFDQLVTRHQAAAYRAALAALRNPQDAEEAAQDAFVRAWGNLHRFRGDSAFRTWLLTIVWNRALSRRRSVTRWWSRRAPLDEALTVASGGPAADSGHDEMRRHVSLVRANQQTNNPLNVDVSPIGIREAKVLTKLGIEYTPQTPANPNGPPLSKLSVRQNMSVWLESGKSMVISQSADPLSDRRLTVEVTATIIR